MIDSFDSKKPGVCPVCGAVLAEADGGLCPRCLMADAGQPTNVPGTAPGSAPPSVTEVAEAFPRFEIIELIGAGGMGTVWRACQPKLHRQVALKLLPASLVERDPAFAERFEREGQLLARLHHPNIVAVHDSGRAGDFFYLLMELVDGVNLRQAMRASRFTPSQALAIVPKICDALQYAHEEGVLHRDIKPENILLDAKGRVKLVDFGIAKLMTQPEAEPTGAAVLRSSGGALTLGDSTLGTPNYMAPEQIERPADVDNRADIYSLGVVFYELLTGELPLGKFVPPSERSATDPRLDGIVQQALEKERDRRQKSVGEMRTQVETIAGKARAASDPAADVTFRGSRFSRTAIVGACWAALAIFAALFLMQLQNPFLGVPPASIAALVKLLILLLLILGFAAPLGATLLGWISVSQIRRSAGRLYGLGLAVADGLLFPLLILDGVLVWGCVAFAQLFVELYSNPSVPNDPHVHPSLTTRMANLLLLHPELAKLVAVVVVIVVDFFIIRAVWRAVSTASAASSPTAPAVPRQTADSPLAYAAMCFAVLSGILGIVALIQWPVPRGLVISILAAALLGILLATPVRKMRLGQSARLIGGSNLALWLLVAAGALLFHRDSAPGEIAGVRYRAFEADAALVERLVPGETRRPGQMLDSELEIPNPPPSLGSPVNVASQTAEISAAVLAGLLTESAREPWLLLDRSIDAYPWPGLADAMSYARIGEYQGTGGLAGLFGIRRRQGALQMRVQYHVTHSLHSDYQHALIVWEGHAPPPGDARAFFLPFTRKDGLAKFLVIAFELSRGEAARSVRPNGSHFSFNNHTVLLHDDNVDVHYALYYGGGNNRSLASGGALEFNSTSPRAWKENYTFHLENGRSFSYQRESPLPDSLLINGKDYDLRQGRILKIHNDGSIEQLKLFPPLSVARQPDALAELIASTRAMTEEPVTVEKLRQQSEAAEAQLRDLLKAYTPTHPLVVEVRESVAALRLKLERQTRQPGASTATPALLAESPKLQFLAWQDAWRANEARGAFHADGSAVTDPSELRLLRHLQATGCDDRGTAEGKRNPRFLHLWFSHPLIDQQSLNEVTLLDGAGQPLQPRDSMLAANAQGAEDGGDDRLGWLTHTLSPGYGPNVPSTVTLRLRYTLGPWERELQIAPDENGIISLGSGSQFNGVGQNAEGKAFFAIAVDMKQDAGRQFGVVAVTRDGRELQPSGGGTGGGIGEAVHIQRFIFTAALAEIAHFRLGTRPVRSVDFQSVPLPAEAATSATAPESSPAKSDGH